MAYALVPACMRACMHLVQYWCLGRQKGRLTRSSISAASSVPVGPPPTTTKLSRRRRSASLVSGRLASSKQALKRSRSCFACSASCFGNRGHGAQKALPQPCTLLCAAWQVSLSCGLHSGRFPVVNLGLCEARDGRSGVDGFEQAEQQLCRDWGWRTFMKKQCSATPGVPKVLGTAPTWSPSKTRIKVVILRCHAAACLRPRLEENKVRIKWRVQSRDTHAASQAAACGAGEGDACAALGTGNSGK